MTDININDLKKNNQKKKNNMIKCYNKIKIMCLTKIKIVSKTDKTNIWFSVPNFLLGHTSYNLDDCINFIINKLKKRGFKTLLLKPNILYIYWNL